MKVYIGSAVWRSLEVGHFRALAPLLQQPGVEYAPVVGDALIERARCISATCFLRRTDADVHLSIDADIMGFSADDALQICEQAMTHDIVGGVYVCRGGHRTFPATFFEDGVRVLMAFDPTPVPVKWVATGFVAVHRRVFEKLAQDMPLLHPKDGDRAFYPFYLPSIIEEPEVGPILLSEDYAFSERARQAGFGIYINPAIRLGHIGQYIYRVEDMGTQFPEPQPIALTRLGDKWRIESVAAKDANHVLAERRHSSV